MVQTRSAHNLEGGDPPQEITPVIRSRTGTVIWPSAFHPTEEESEDSEDANIPRFISMKPEGNQVTIYDMHTICPACGSTTIPIRGRFVCSNCHVLVQGCCD